MLIGLLLFFHSIYYYLSLFQPVNPRGLKRKIHARVQNVKKIFSRILLANPTELDCVPGVYVIKHPQVKPLAIYLMGIGIVKQLTRQVGSEVKPVYFQFPGNIQIRPESYVVRSLPGEIAGFGSLGQLQGKLISERRPVSKLQKEPIFELIIFFLVIYFIPVGKQNIEIIDKLSVQSGLDAGQIGFGKWCLPEFVAAVNLHGRLWIQFYRAAHIIPIFPGIRTPD
jgi:hypothetical protein